MNNNTIDFNKLRNSITTGGNLVDELRKSQQARYDREDKAILEAIGSLSLANYYLTNTFNVEENN